MLHTSIFRLLLFLYCSCFYQFHFVTKTHVLIILDEWTNFLERLGSKVTHEDIRYWASFRGQTLSRTGNLEYGSHFVWKLITEIPLYKLPDSFHYVLSSSRNDVLQEGIETSSILRQDK